MPDASTGGTGDRGNTRSPGTTSANDTVATGRTPFPRDVVPEGYVRVDMQAGTDIVTFTTPTETFTDRVREVRMDITQTVTYTCESGRSFTVDDTWRFSDGGVIPIEAITWAVTRVDVATFGDTAPRYGVGGGGYIANSATPRLMPEYVAQMNQGFVRTGYIAPNTARIQVGYQAACGCEMCRQSRAQWTETNEQRYQREEENRARLRRERRQEEARVAEAEARAEETLRMVLNPAELAHYDETKEIVVTGSDGKRYMIGTGLINNVHLLDGPTGYRVLASLCCHPELEDNRGGCLPYKDAHIAQILYLRHDLKRFWKTANISWRDVGARDEYLDRTRRLSDRIFRRDAW